MRIKTTESIRKEVEEIVNISMEMKNDEQFYIYDFGAEESFMITVLKYDNEYNLTISEYNGNGRYKVFRYIYDVKFDDLYRIFMEIYYEY